MDLLWLALIAAGAFVGLAVGLTGIGGGSLMTPILLMFGFPPHIAIGTDLWYAAITKSSGVVSHQKSGNIDWSIVKSMAVGSIPAALVTLLILKLFFKNANEYSHILTIALGIMLVLTSLTILLRSRIKIKVIDADYKGPGQRLSRSLITCSFGVLIGIFVTLSSVGAGAIGTAVLLSVYPHLVSQRVVGTEIAHAVPLTLIAGIGHLWLGNVDFVLLGCLLIGSLPAVHLGTYLGNRLPNQVLQPILASILFGVGLKLVFF